MVRQIVDFLILCLISAVVAGFVVTLLEGFSGSELPSGVFGAVWVAILVILWRKRRGQS